MRNLNDNGSEAAAGAVSTHVEEPGAEEEEDAYLAHADLPWQVVMLGDGGRMRAISYHMQRWWDRNQAAKQAQAL